MSLTLPCFAMQVMPLSYYDLSHDTLRALTRSRDCILSSGHRSQASQTVRSAPNITKPCLHSQKRACLNAITRVSRCTSRQYHTMPDLDSLMLPSNRSTGVHTYPCPNHSFSTVCQIPMAFPICPATANAGTSRRRGLVHPHLQLCRLLRLRHRSLGSPFQLCLIGSSPARATA